MENLGTRCACGEASRAIRQLKLWHTCKEKAFVCLVLCLKGSTAPVYTLVFSPVSEYFALVKGWRVWPPTMPQAAYAAFFLSMAGIKAFRSRRLMNMAAEMSRRGSQ